MAINPTQKNTTVNVQRSNITTKSPLNENQKDIVISILGKLIDQLESRVLQPREVTSPNVNAEEVRALNKLYKAKDNLENSNLSIKDALIKSKISLDNLGEKDTNITVKGKSRIFEKSADIVFTLQAEAKKVIEDTSINEPSKKELQQKKDSEFINIQNEIKGELEKLQPIKETTAKGVENKLK